MLRFKKHIALLSFLVLLIPLVVQTFHAFEKHEKKTCCTKNQRHICEYEYDCNDLHLLQTYFSHDFNTGYQTIVLGYNPKLVVEQKQIFVSFYSLKTPSRAPPVLV